VKILEDPRFIEIDKRLGGPLVYIFHTSARVLYIGMSINGIHRTLNPSHDARFKMRHYAEEDVKISVLFCESRKEAVRIEQELIAEYRPLYNTKHKVKLQAANEYVYDSYYGTWKLKK
jgi:excinuclease UvrABC nuclease subunit